MVRDRTVAARTTIAVAAATALALSAAPAVGQADDDMTARARAVGFDACSTAAGYDTCAGEVPSFDGLELEGRIALPRGATGPVPLVVVLHGWGGNRQYVFGDPRAYEPNVWGPGRFLSRGYAVLAYSARGFAASCGTFDVVMDVNADGGTGPDGEAPDGCVRGHTHVAERGVEGRDTQHLLGLLVDAGLADPERLAVVGSSYGGGQAWLLATALPWRSPAGRELQLAAAVAAEGWTDLLDALAPNGRATDGTSAPGAAGVPFGVPKTSFFSTVHRQGRTMVPPVDPVPFDPLIPFAGGRYNTTDPGELHSYLDGWQAVFSAGDPYTSPLAQALPAALEGKSARYAEDYLAAVSARTVRPVPVFAVQGWTDALFPASQALSMYHRLRAAHPGYPISLVLADVGHGAQNPPAAQSHWHEQATSFLDAALAGGEPGRLVTSLPTSCDGGAPSPVAAGTWSALQGAPLHRSSDEPQRTDSVRSDLGEEVAADPVAAGYVHRLDREGLGGPLHSSHPACVRRPAGALASGARWRWSLPDDGAVLLGLPRVSVDYRMTGGSASLVARLWDVSPDGSKTLVTRGVHRLSTAAGDPQQGTVELSLFGNHWVLAPDHELELELGQRDTPFLRPDNASSSLDISRVAVQLPTSRR